jgi:hypothetical protein
LPLEIKKLKTDSCNAKGLFLHSSNRAIRLPINHEKTELNGMTLELLNDYPQIRIEVIIAINATVYMVANATVESSK